MKDNLPVLYPLGVFDMGELPARSHAGDVQRRQLLVWHGRKVHDHVVASADSAPSLKQRHDHTGHHACSNLEPQRHRYTVRSLASCIKGVPSEPEAAQDHTRAQLGLTHSGSADCPTARRTSGRNSLLKTSTCGWLAALQPGR